MMLGYLYKNGCLKFCHVEKALFGLIFMWEISPCWRVLFNFLFVLHVSV